MFIYVYFKWKFPVALWLSRNGNHSLPWKYKPTKHLLSFSDKVISVVRDSYRLGCSATESARLYILCSLFRWQHKPQAHSIGLFRPARLRVLGSFSSYTLSVEGGIGYMRLGIPKRIRLCVDSHHIPHENGWWVYKKVISSIHLRNNLFSFRC
jgi:hypothetical protein